MEIGKSKRSARSALAAATLALLLPAAPLQADLPRAAPIQNFRVPTLSPTGVRTRLITGREALYLNENEIKITGLQITLFDPAGTGQDLTTLQSPQALIHLDDKKLRASGPGQIIIRHQNLAELTGRDWTYDHTDQRITIKQDVRVTYQASLPALLK